MVWTSLRFGGALGLAMLVMHANSGALASSAAVDEVHYTWLSSTSLAFDWRGAPNDLRYGLTAAYGSTVQGSTPNPLPFSSAGPFWQAILTDLSPATTYHYSIGGSADQTFATPPVGSYRFDVEGDVGSTTSYPNVGPTQAAIAADDPAFVLVIGDLSYGNDHGQAAVDQHFNDVMAWSQTAAYMPAWGNHEWDTPTADDLRNYKGRFVLPNQHASAGAPSAGCCGADWGWFDVGPVRFISFPEPYASTTWPDWQQKADPIFADAQANPAIHFIVTYGHRPAYSTGHHAGDPTLQKILDSFGDRYSKYLLNLNGHSHDYERFVPIHNVTHITAAGGGATLESYCCALLPQDAFRADHLEHVRIDVTPASLTLAAICGPPTTADDIKCTAGAVIDSVTINASEVAPVPALTVTPASGGAPLAATADASASTDGDATPIAGYTFDFGDGTVVGPQPTPTAQHVYRAAGTYQVTLTVTDTAGLSSTATATVAITADAPPTAGLVVTPNLGTPPLTVTADATTSVDADATGITGYSFAFGDGTVVGPQASPLAQHVYTTGGTFTATVTVTDSAGLSGVASAAVTVGTGPEAALTVSPAWGVAPLPIKADASGAADPTGAPLTSFRFDFGDGTVVGPQPSSSATHTYSTGGTYGVTVTGTSASGLTSNGSTSVDVRPNLVGNPGFETDTSGWNASGSGSRVTLARVAGGHSGDWSAQLWNSGTASAVCALNDAPNWVASAQAETYDASTWVRSDSAGGQVKIRIRAYLGSTLVGQSIQHATLGLDWQQLSVSYPAPPGVTLDVNVYSTAGPGACFYADDVTLTADRLAPGLTVTPLSGLQPLTVTADASATTDADATPVTGFTFDFGDGSPAVSQAAPVASHRYTAAGSYRVSVTATDSEGAFVTTRTRVTVDAAPVAVLTVVNGGGASITADASGSSDADTTPIASYTFDFGDGTGTGPQATPTAGHTYAAGGSYSVAVMVTDIAGYSGTASATVSVDPNLVGNPGFETDLTGWNTAGSSPGVTVGRVPGGSSGSWSALAVNGGAAGATCVVNDSPNWVIATTSGTYSASAKIRADSAGTTVKLRLREYSGGVLVNTVESSLVVGPQWQPLSLSYSPLAAGSALDLNVLEDTCPLGNVFYVDDVSITLS